MGKYFFFPGIQWRSQLYACSDRDLRMTSLSMHRVICTFPEVIEHRFGGAAEILIDQACILGRAQAIDVVDDHGM